MTPELVPMLLLSLLLMASDGVDAGVANLVLSGDHRLDDTHEAVIVADATVTVPDDATVTAPIYLISGTTRVDGAVHARLTQLAGTLIVGEVADIAELRHISGTRSVHEDADIERRTSVDLATDSGTPRGTIVSLTFLVLALAVVGARLEHTRRRNLDTMVRAIARHPVVTATVGLLLTLTALSLFVFMAFTLVLIPVAILGLAGGVAVTALGVVVGFVLLSGLGAVAITYIGFADFQPAPLPD